LEIVVARKNSTVNVSLASVGVGHALPTGDAFRRLQWRLCADPACREIIAQRSFGILHQGPTWNVALDTRLKPGIEEKFSVAAIEGELWWDLVYSFGDPMQERVLTEEDIRTVVAEGVLPAG
jgi:hypothetical protein